MEQIINSSYLWITITFAAYIIGKYVHKKTGTYILAPILIAIIIVASIIKISGVPYQAYKEATKPIYMLLLPATICLAVPIHRQMKFLRKNLFLILVGTFIGAITAMGSVYILCRLFGIDSTLLASLVPKSITSAIAIDVSSKLGGIPSITVVCLMITGLTGAITLPKFLRIFKITDSLETGLAMGTAAHVLGTTRAVEIGEVESAAAGIAVVLTGIFTVIVAMAFHII